MSEKKYDLLIVFEKLDALSEEEPEIRLSAGEIEEYEEIRILREIVSEIQDPPQNYITTT